MACFLKGILCCLGLASAFGGLDPGLVNPGLNRVFLWSGIMSRLHWDGIAGNYEAEVFDIRKGVRCANLFCG